MTRRNCLFTVGLIPLLAMLVGCQAMAAPFLMWGPEPTRTVDAEYPYLDGKNASILISADYDTLFEYPWVQLELAKYVQVALETHLPKVVITPPRTVVDYQRRDVDWDRKPPALVGKNFDAERVVLIELTQYSTREPDSPHLFRGRIGARVRVYDTAYPDAEPAYSTDVEVAYPEDSAGEWGSNDRAIRKQTMELFAEELAGKFYDRKVKIR